MPFTSQAQRGWMHANKPEMAKRWEKHTPKGKKLPEHVKKSAVSSKAFELGFELGMSKTAKEMPHFTEQDRPDGVKKVYRALKEEHSGMPAEMKARIAARQGKPGKQHQGPPYKGPLSTDK